MAEKVLDRLEVPADFFKYLGPADASGNSLYKCLHCPPGVTNKSLSCHDKSRQNLKKHIQVNVLYNNF